MRRRAFTLVELIIALSLLALVAALALPAAITLLAREGNRSALFALESAIQTVRAKAMRDGALMEIGALEEGDRWHLVARPYNPQDESAPGASEEPLDIGSDDPDDEDAEWETIATLPQSFAFRFEPMPTLMESLQQPPDLDAPVRPGSDPEAQRVAIALPNGAIEGVDAWRLVTESTTETPRVQRLAIARWTGAVTATIERADDDPMATPPEDTPEPEPAP